MLRQMNGSKRWGFLVRCISASTLIASVVAGSGSFVVAPAGASNAGGLGVLSVVAGNGSQGPATPGPATSSSLAGPLGVAVDAAGDIYVADSSNHMVEKVAPGGTLSIVAGTGSEGPATPGTATSSKLGRPEGLAVDASGNLYIADFDNYQVYKVSPSGTLSIVAGSGTQGYATPGPATSSPLFYPVAVAVDATGNVYVSDDGADEIDKVSPDGTLSLFAGTGAWGRPVPGPAASSPIGEPSGIAVDSSGNVYIADRSWLTVYKVTPGGTLSIVAGVPGHNGPATPGPATSSDLYVPDGLATDAVGDFYIADFDNCQVYKVTPGGTLSIVAGTGVCSPSTPGTATSSSLAFPAAIAVDSLGDVLIAEYVANQVDMVEGALPPSAPSNVIATASNAGASVAFLAPPAGHSAITSYTVTATDTTTPANGGETATGTSSPITVGRLTNGDSYTFTVKATNGIGTGQASAPSAAVTPATTPDAPTGVHATRGDGAATVGFTAPSGNGSAITSFTVTATDSTTPANGGETATGTASPVTVSGLTDGDSYTFRVTATNGVGTSAPSSPSSAVIPVGVPGAPRNVVGTVDHGRSVISWTPGPSHGSTITSYTASVVGNSSLHCTYVVATPEQDHCLISGLTDATTYTFQVTATNTLGTGAAGTSAAVTTEGVPGAPTGVTVTPGDAQALVSWSAPADGGSPITGYTVVATDQTVSTASISWLAPVGATSLEVRGLVAGDSYKVTIMASNALGSGPASSPSSSFDVTGPDPAVLNRIVLSRGRLIAQWSEPSVKWGPIVRYVVTAQDSTGHVAGSCLAYSGSSVHCAIKGLAPSTTYNVSVVALERRWNWFIVTSDYSQRSNVLSAST